MKRKIFLAAVLMLGVLANTVFAENEDFKQPTRFNKDGKNNTNCNDDKCGQTYLKLTKTDKKFRNGLVKLKLEYIRDGKLQDYIWVNSGTKKNQFFRTGEKSESQSLEPLPEGKWYIHNIDFAGARDDYDEIFSEDLGPVKIPLEYLSPGKTERSAILIHLDWNASTSPGTAGCVGVTTINDFKKLIGWLRETDPRSLYVDWGLGTVKIPN